MEGPDIVYVATDSGQDEKDDNSSERQTEHMETEFRAKSNGIPNPRWWVTKSRYLLHTG